MQIFSHLSQVQVTSSRTGYSLHFLTLFQGKILSILTTVTQPFSDRQVPLVQHFHAQGKIILLRVIYFLLLSLLITIASIVDPSWIDSIVSAGLFYFTQQCGMPDLLITLLSIMEGVLS